MTERKAAPQDRPLTLAGRQFTTRMSFLSWVWLEDRWGLGQEEVRARVQAGRIRDLPAVVTATLQSHHPDVTEAEVMRLLDEAGVDGLKDALGQVIGDGEAPPDPPANRAARRAAKSRSPRTNS